MSKMQENGIQNSGEGDQNNHEDQALVSSLARLNIEPLEKDALRLQDFLDVKAKCFSYFEKNEDTTRVHLFCNLRFLNRIWAKCLRSYEELKVIDDLDKVLLKINETFLTMNEKLGSLNVLFCFVWEDCLGLDGIINVHRVPVNSPSLPQKRILENMAHILFLSLQDHFILERDLKSLCESTGVDFAPDEAVHAVGDLCSNLITSIADLSSQNLRTETITSSINFRVVARLLEVVPQRHLSYGSIRKLSDFIKANFLWDKAMSESYESPFGFTFLEPMTRILIGVCSLDENSACDKTYHKRMQNIYLKTIQHCFRGLSSLYSMHLSNWSTSRTHCSGSKCTKDNKFRYMRYISAIGTLVEAFDLNDIGFETILPSIMVLFNTAVRNPETLLKTNCTKCEGIKADIPFVAVALLNKLTQKLCDSAKATDSDEIESMMNIFLSQNTEFFSKVEEYCRAETKGLYLKVIDNLALVTDGLYEVMPEKNKMLFSSLILGHGRSNGVYEVRAKFARVIARVLELSSYYETASANLFIDYFDTIRDGISSGLSSFTWALGNWSDGLIAHGKHVFSDDRAGFQLSLLKDAVMDCLKLKKDRYNAYRVVGNIFKIASSDEFKNESEAKSAIEPLVHAVLMQINHGSDFKARWNAAHALRSFWTNQYLMELCSKDLKFALIDKIIVGATKSENFKERTECLASLTIIDKEHFDRQYVVAWRKIVRSLKVIDSTNEDYVACKEVLQKYFSQAGLTITHLTTLIDTSDVTEIAEIVRPEIDSYESVLKVTQQTVPASSSHILVSYEIIEGLLETVEKSTRTEDNLNEMRTVLKGLLKK